MFGGIQMLLGISKQLEDTLVKQGIPLEVYVPFGPELFAYSVRRMRESPSFALSVLRMLLFEGIYSIHHS